MRIHASGVGKTLDDALVKVRKDLESSARHERDVEEVKKGGKVEYVAHDPNPHAKELEGYVRALAAFVSPVEGWRYRILVNVNQDPVDASLSSARIEVDLVKE